MLVGYNAVYDPSVMRAKRRLISGAIGTIRKARVIACAPRKASYYKRSPWAGRIAVHGQWVLDSPLQNAMSHWLTLALFLLGQTDDAAAQPALVEAELYRANAIENYDTISLRVQLRGQSPVALHVYMSHACEHTTPPTVEIIGTDGTLCWTRPAGGRFVGGRADGEVFPAGDAYRPLLTGFARVVRGEPHEEAAVATLEVARAPLVVVNAASESARVTDIPSSAIGMRTEAGGDSVRFIHGIDEAFQDCAARDQMLHESGRFKWSVPAAGMPVAEYRSFGGVRA